ncbi:MAG: hypothetical protein PHF56_02645 [Desulfuromonadaceae bacterium]|nr:hypothetical protein [Desulfuromonadaceae bacterium]
MQVSAEIRWFWRNAPPPDLWEWFCNVELHSGSAGGGKARVDNYLSDVGQVELGIKNRGEMKETEVKGLVDVIGGGLTIAPFVGPIELWSKWTSNSLELGASATLPIEKQRWLRKFDTSKPVPVEIELNEDEKPYNQKPLPTLGCNVELTQVRLLQNGDVWWTFGFEAFGTIRTVENDLRAVASILATRQAPALGDALLASYPAWLTSNAFR